jgi:hypothetical protein
MVPVENVEVIREEIKARRRSRPGSASPQTLVSQVETGSTDLIGKTSTPRLRPVKAEISVATAITRRFPQVTGEIPPKLVAIKVARPAPREFEGTTVEGTQPKELKVAVQGKQIELKPRIPRAEVPREAPKPGELSALVRRPPEGLPKLTPRVPELVTPKTAEAPPVRKPLELTRAPPQPKPPKPVEGALEDVLIESAQEVEPRGGIPEEKLVMPHFLEELSSAARPIGRPLCIVVPRRETDPGIYFVAAICREIYRVVKGGRPEPRWISEGLKDEIERYLKAEGMVFVLDDSKCKLLQDLSGVRSVEDLEKVRLDLLYDRLRELFSQDFGFVVFHINDKLAERFAEKLEKEVGANVRIITVRPPVLERGKVLARIFWGFVEGEGRNLDEVFKSCEGKFISKLKEAWNDVRLLHWLEIDKNAGWEHEAMKAIVVECLAKELGAVSKDDVIRMLRDGVIRTECELGGGRRADICVRGGRYVEVETFYGLEKYTGDPIMKLDKETLEKYKGRGVRRVDVVLLTGLHALLYVRELVELRKVYHEEGIEVNFYVPNVKDRKLVPLDEILRLLREEFGLQGEAEESSRDVSP